MVAPEDPAYDDARQVFFKGVDRRPVAVAQVAGAEEVAPVVSIARDTDLELAVRSGGHSRAGYGTTEGGIVIDLSEMKSLDIDADGRTAWVETGITAGEYTVATGERGLVTGLGDAGSVGIGGITLAGGIGFLVRKNGLTIDDLLAAEVVTADGKVVETSEDSEPDLFWAIRGGEGNFGIATRFKLRLHEISEIVGGMLVLPATPEVITGFLEAAGAAPEELSTIANVMVAPPMPFIPEEAHGKPVVIGLLAYVGPADQADEVIAPFRALAEPYADMVRPMRYPELYEGPEPEARFASGTNFFADSLERLGGRGDLRAAAQVDGDDEGRPAAGARRRVGAGSQRRHRVRAPRPRAVRQRRGDVRGRGRERHPRRLGRRASRTRSVRTGRAATSASSARRTRRRSAPPTRARPGTGSARLKRRYDPDNLFRLNHNIPPAAG